MNVEQINNITEEINNNVNVTNKPKKEYKFTEKRKLAYEKMRKARKKKIEDMRNRKIEDGKALREDTEKIPPPPKLKRSKAIDMKQEIIKSSSSSERLLFIHDKILTEINYLCMIDNLKNNLPIGIVYNISKFI